MKQKLDIIIPLLVLLLVLASMVYPVPALMIGSTMALSGYLLWDWYESRNRWILFAAVFFVVLLIIRLTISYF